jgi:hypothetical protein
LPFTTDGPRIFFTEVIGGIRVVRQLSSAGGEAVSVPGIPDDGAFFPTDSDIRHASLLLTKVRNPCCEIWTVPMLGGSPRPAGNFVGREGVWSPDGQKMAYIGNDHGLDGCVFVATSTAAMRVRLCRLIRPSPLPRGCVGRLTAAACASRSLIPRPTPNPCGKLPPTEPVCIRCCRIGAVSVLSAVAVGLRTAGTSSLNPAMTGIPTSGSCGKARISCTGLRSPAGSPTGP